MNKIVQIFKLKNLSKDIITFIVSFLYYQRDEIYFRNKHFKEIQHHINFLVMATDWTARFFNQNFYTEYKIRKKYTFGYDIDFYDVRKANKYNGHTVYNNSLRIYIQCYFCFICGNYIENTELKPYNMKIICQCE